MGAVGSDVVSTLRCSGLFHWHVEALEAAQGVTSSSTTNEEIWAYVRGGEGELSLNQIYILGEEYADGPL